MIYPAAVMNQVLSRSAVSRIRAGGFGASIRSVSSGSRTSKGAASAIAGMQNATASTAGAQYAYSSSFIEGKQPQKCSMSTMDTLETGTKAYMDLYPEDSTDGGMCCSGA